MSWISAGFGDSCYDSHYDSAATTAMAVAATAAATAATTQPRRFDGRDIQATCTWKIRLLSRQVSAVCHRRPGHYLPRRIRFQCESEAARTAQRTKSSGRGRRLLVVVILRNWQLRRHLCLLYKLQRL